MAVGVCIGHGSDPGVHRHGSWSDAGRICVSVLDLSSVPSALASSILTFRVAVWPQCSHWCGHMFNMSVSSHKGAKRRTNGCKPQWRRWCKRPPAPRGDKKTLCFRYKRWRICLGPRSLHSCDPSCRRKLEQQLADKKRELDMRKAHERTLQLQVR